MARAGQSASLENIKYKKHQSLRINLHLLRIHVIHSFPSSFTMMSNLPIHILLADDDPDDRLFFAKALERISIDTMLETVEDGAMLLAHLSTVPNHVPDVLFLDINMPRQNGMECLVQIKADEKLRALPVVMYSTALNENIADIFFREGAHYFLRKTDLSDLVKQLHQVLVAMVESKYERVDRSKFILDSNSGSC